MSASRNSLIDRIAAAWPAALWRDVHVLVGASGGPDSMALVQGLLELKGKAGGAGCLHVGHVNHQLRGECSAADEAWLRQQCKDLGVPIVVRRVDTAALAAREGDGL